MYKTILAPKIKQKKKQIEYFYMHTIYKEKGGGFRNPVLR